MCAALARNSNGYDIVLWIDARHLTSIDDLHDYHVARSSSSINLFALVRSRPCWLIFDNLQVALDSDMLLATMHAGSRVLATSQHKGHGSYELRDVDRETARNILEQHAALKCPDDVWLLIDATVGGYPLLLELMGALARTEGWDAVREVCPDAIRLDDRRYERVCDRILARHRASLQEELTFLRWLDSRVMDPRLLRYVAGSTAARRLDARGLLIPSSDESLRIHDMVHASINATVPHPDAISDALYARKMDAFFATHDDRLLRDRAARIHRVVLARLLQTGGAGPSVRHSYVTVYKGDADPILLRSPEQMAEALTRTAPEALSAEVHATIEEIEAHYVITRDRDGAAAGQQRLAEFLPLISKALTRVVSDLSLHRYVLHHQGKFLFWLGRYNDAERLFSELLATSPEYAEPRLQRAILYNRSDRPQPALLDIEFLFNQQHQQKNVSVTVQLAALAQLVRHANERIGELIDNNREDIDAAFRSAIATRHPIALEAMEALGSSLGYERPNFVAEFLDYFGGWQPSTNKERLSWAGVLKQFGKALRNVDGSRAQTLLAEAANWYSQTIITTDYQASQAADAFLEINRPDTAWDALGASMEAHSPFWLQRAAQVLLALERPEDALQHIDQALSLLNDKQQRYRAAMFQDRFRIRQRLSDPRAREDLEAAVHASSSPKFREELLRQLQEWDRSATTGDASDS